MKKIFTLFLGMIIALSAVAAPALKGQKKDLKFGKELPQIENVKAQRVAAPLFKDSKFIAKAPAAKKDVVTPTAVQAVYYGTFDYAMKYTTDLVNNWSLIFFSGDSLDYVGEVSFVSEAGNKIAGDYQQVTGFAVFAAGDTAEIEGSLVLTAIDFNGNYTIELQATDADAREWNFTGTLNVLALDYLYYIYEYYDYMFISLDDYEVEPSGEIDSLVVSEGLVNDNVESKGWWVFGGYTADSVYIQFSNAGTTDHIVDTYAFADLDAAYSYVEIDGAQIFFSDAQIEISINSELGTYHAEGTATGKNGIEYVITMDEKYIAPSLNVITPAYDETTRTLALTTTNTDTYFFYIESQEEYDKYESDFSQESLVEEINAWIAAMQQEGYLSYFTLSGDMVIDVVKFFGSDAETGDYVALIAPMTADGDINGTATYLQFLFDYPEGVEEVVAAGKAAKIVRDGQLLILKGDKVFNAFGAQLK